MKIVNLKDIPLEKPQHGNYLKKTMINDGELSHLFAFAQVTLNPGDETEQHGHDGRCEVFLVEKGKVKITSNKNEEIIGEEGACIITYHDETHSVSNPFSEPVILTYFQLKP